MDKDRIKKIILYFSYIPYVSLIFMMVFYTIFGYNAYGTTRYGLDALTSYINFVVFDMIMSVGPVIILAICIIYQIYYFINVKGTKRKKSRNEGVDTLEQTDEIEEMEILRLEKRGKVRKIFFIISLMCWGLYLLSGAYAFFFGIESGLFETYTVYGFEALKEALFWNIIIFSVIPILPISVIYIIVYIISNKIKKKKEMNKII